MSEGAIGNRNTRVALNCLGYYWSEQPKRVAALGAIGTGLNLYNTVQRLDALRANSKNNLGVIDTEKQQHAGIRLGMLGAPTVAGSWKVYKLAKADFGK